MVMFAELPPWDLERKYLPSNLEVRSLTSLLFQGGCVCAGFSGVRKYTDLSVWKQWHCYLFTIRIWRATFPYKLRHFPDVLTWTQNSLMNMKVLFSST